MSQCKIFFHYLIILFSTNILVPVLQMAEVLQVELSAVLCQIDGVYILDSSKHIPVT